jgi:uncharacterized protein (DUF433 family)
MVLSTATVAFAQGNEPPATPTPPNYAQTFWQTLADKLGVTVEKLQSAIRDALTATVNKMLADGKLTQQQADQAKAAIDKLTFNRPLFGQFLGARRGAGFAISQAALDAAAQKLGMTTQALMTELRGGKTLADVAKEKNVSTDDLKAAIVKTVGAQIDQAVKDGKLTQAQADKAKTELNNLSLDQLWFKRGPANMPGARFAMGQEVLNAAAQKLGMTPQALMTELRSGKTLTDTAKEKNVSPDDLKAAIVAAVDARIDQAVKDGTLTQAQADQIKAQVSQMNLDNYFGYGFGNGWGRGWFNLPFGRRGYPAPRPATPQGSSS